MKILLCAATEMEIAPTIQFLSTHEFDNIDILVTGVGLMTSTYALTKSVHSHRPHMILQAGIAGTLEPQEKLAKVVVVRNEIIGDLGVKENGNFQSIFDLKLLSQDMYPWKKGRLTNDNEILETTPFPIVDGVTVNEISTSEERILYYRNQLKAQVETMEGAALHYVGLMEKIPFLQLRSFSNFIGERDKTKWKIKQAISNLNRELQNLLTKYLAN